MAGHYGRLMLVSNMIIGGGLGSSVFPIHTVIFPSIFLWLSSFIFP